jgi:hypothetical protein
MSDTSNTNPFTRAAAKAGGLKETEKAKAQMEETKVELSESEIEYKFSEPKEKQTLAKRFVGYLKEFTVVGSATKGVKYARGERKVQYVDDNAEKEEKEQKLMKGPLVQPTEMKGAKRKLQKTLDENKVVRVAGKAADEINAAGFGKINEKILGENWKANLPLSVVRRVEANLGDAVTVLCDIAGAVPVVGLAAAPGNAVGAYLSAHGRGYDKKRAAAAAVEGTTVGMATGSVPIVGQGVAAVALANDLKKLVTPIPSATKAAAVEQLYEARDQLREQLEYYVACASQSGVKLNCTPEEWDGKIAKMNERLEGMTHYIDKYVALIDKSMKHDATGKYHQYTLDQDKREQGEEEYQEKVQAKRDEMIEDLEDDEADL